MHSSPNASSVHTTHYPDPVTASAQPAAGDAVSHEAAQPSKVLGSPPKVLEGRQQAGFTGLIEESGMEVDDAENTFASRGQKRKRELSGDLHQRHSPPKLRHVDHDEGHTSSSLCKVAIPDKAAYSQRIVDADGSMTAREIKGDGTTDEGTASSNTSLTGSAMATGALASTGARLDQVDNEGNAALHLAARYGNNRSRKVATGARCAD